MRTYRILQLQLYNVQLEIVKRYEIKSSTTNLKDIHIALFNSLQVLKIYKWCVPSTLILVNYHISRFVFDSYSPRCIAGLLSAIFVHRLHCSIRVFSPLNSRTVNTLAIL